MRDGRMVATMVGPFTKPAVPVFPPTLATRDTEFASTPTL